MSSDQATDRQQQSVYFDTPEQQLLEAGLSLRIRTIGDRRIQTIKAESSAAAGLFVRPEWECEINGDAPVLEDDDAPISGVVPAADVDRLKPLFRVEVTRRTVLVERADAVIEVVFDRGAVHSATRSDPVHEVELELKRGEPAALFELARDLDQSVPVRLGVLTKSERGYRLATTDLDKPVKTGLLTLRPGTSTAAGFRMIVGACVRQFRLNEDILRRTGNAGALHQARVSLRRLRSALSTFKTIVADDQYDQLRTELRWIAAELGHARNLDVMLERVSSRKAGKPLHAARKSAYEAVQTALASERTRALMLDMAEWTAIGSWASDDVRSAVREEAIEVFAAAALDKHRRRLKRLGRNLDEVSDDERHDVRIEAKKLRYATEFFASLFRGKKPARRYKAFHEALAALQANLGDLNDLATAPIVIAELSLAGTPTADALEPDMSRRDPLIKEAADAYATLMDSKPFWR
ncbi:CHAD domain-containing protein [Sphingomonas radiodurans]|nr:CHAD domain-containing protein [Sphingomonas radiodurans]WBH18347.1 CHAD domain-containing protein [Sphingomonas radiodurans]